MLLSSYWSIMNISDKSSPELSLNFYHLSDTSMILPIKPLGAILQRAGLVSSSQIEMALQQQKQGHKLRIGDILVMQGWLNPQTADFFAEKFWTLLTRQSKEPLGYYLKEAALLDEKQIAAILSEQQQVKLKFGELAVKKGWLKQDTLDFFLEYLLPGYKSNFKPEQTDEDLDVANQLQYEQAIRDRFLKIKLKLLHLEGVRNLSPQLLEEVLSWTRGQSFLTQKLCQLISESDGLISPGEESLQVQQLVQTRIIDDWENQEGAKHFKTIRDRLLHNQQCQPKNLLQAYQKISSTDVLVNDSPEHSELLNLGLVVKKQQQLRVSNPIYQAVFNLDWVEGELANLYHNFIKTTEPSTEKEKLLITKEQQQKTKAKSRSKLNWKNILLFLGLMGLLLLFSQIILERWKARTLFREGNELLSQKQYKKAVAQYNRLLNTDSNYYQAWTNRGYALAGLGEYEKMLESCSSATIVAPKAVYAWNCQGEALFNLNRYEEAIASYDQAIKLAPQEPIFWINKSEALTALQQYDESLITVEQAINLLEAMEKAEGRDGIKKELAVAWNYKARMLAAKRQYEEAIAAYDRSLEYVPQYFPAQIGKGVALKKLQRYAEASEKFLNILENNPQLTKNRKAVTWFYLGKTLCESSQTSEAIAAFETALRFKPDYPAAARAKENCR